MCYIMRQQLQELDENCARRRSHSNHIPSHRRSFPALLSPQALQLSLPFSSLISQVAHEQVQIHKLEYEEKETTPILEDSNHLNCSQHLMVTLK